MAETKVLSCNCSNGWQDRRYGKQRRLHNKCKQDGQRPPRWRCTVCAETKQP